MLHGIGSNAQSFGALIERLPQDWDITVWDAPGYGASEPLSEFWPTEEHYSRALHAFLDAIAWGNGHILGHSLGTLMAAKFAQTYPARIKRLVLVSCALGYRISRDGTMPAKVASRIEDLEQFGAEKFAASRAERLVYDPQNNPHCVEQVRQSMAKVTLPGYAHATRMLASGQLEKSLWSVACPTLFLIGNNDVVTPMEQSQKAFAARQQAGNREAASMIVVPESGHAICQQSPVSVARHLTDFLGEEAEPWAAHQRAQR
jgi:pimeloyl-ACP methyl ester carboxylesterase